jgi:predicted CopG family antitoxin
MSFDSFLASNCRRAPCGSVIGIKSLTLYGCVFDMVRQVSPSEEAYARLKKAKRVSESFSNAILRIVKSPTGDLNPFFGDWEGEDYARVEEKIVTDRKSSRSRDARFKFL